jgi:Cu(I)/Ag(I) efflux system protein CusF
VLLAVAVFIKAITALEKHLKKSPMNRYKPALAALLASSLFSTFSAFAQASLPQTEGEVRKIDKDPALLGKVKAGDKVRFTADLVNDTLTVLSIEPSK